MTRSNSVMSPEACGAGPLDLVGHRHPQDVGGAPGHERDDRLEAKLVAVLVDRCPVREILIAEGEVVDERDARRRRGRVGGAPRELVLGALAGRCAGIRRPPERSPGPSSAAGRRAEDRPVPRSATAGGRRAESPGPAGPRAGGGGESELRSLELATIRRREDEVAAEPRTGPGVRALRARPAGRRKAPSADGFRAPLSASTAPTRRRPRALRDPRRGGRSRAPAGSGRLPPSATGRRPVLDVAVDGLRSGPEGRSSRLSYSAAVRPAGGRPLDVRPKCGKSWHLSLHQGPVPRLGCEPRSREISRTRDMSRRSARTAVSWLGLDWQRRGHPMQIFRRWRGTLVLGLGTRLAPLARGWGRPRKRPAGPRFGRACSPFCSFFPPAPPSLPRDSSKRPFASGSRARHRRPDRPPRRAPRALGAGRPELR